MHLVLTRWRPTAGQQPRANTPKLLGALVVALAAGLPILTATAASASPTPTFTREWTYSSGLGAILNSTPVVITASGGRDVVVGDTSGRLTAISLSGGSEDWQTTTTASVYSSCGDLSGIESPLSATTVSGSTSTLFAEVAGGEGGDGGTGATYTEPDYQAFNSSGTRVNDTNLSQESGGTSTCTGNYSSGGVNGIALSDVSGSWNGYSGSTRGHVLWGLEETSGTTIQNPPPTIYDCSPTPCGFFNSDSTNTTPAVGPLPDTQNVSGGVAQEVISTSDQSGTCTAGPCTAGQTFDGGHLRVEDPQTGDEICNANLYPPSNNDGNGSSFDSSPAVGSLGGIPLVLFGEGTRWQEAGTPPTPLSTHLDAYNTDCNGEWSQNLGGYTNFSPAIANVQGTGTPWVIEQATNSSGSPVVWEINGNDSTTYSQTLTCLNGQGCTEGNNCSGVNPDYFNQSDIAVDLTGDGYDDIIAPAGNCGIVVLDGKTLAEVGQYNPSSCPGGSMTIDNTPLATSDGSGGVDVILAGRAASGGGCVVEYDVSSGSMDSGAWPEFHHDAQLSGFYPNTVPVQQYPTAPWSDRLGPRADLVSGSSNNTICSRTGQYCAVLQNSDGNFVFYNGSTACWNSATEGNEGDSLWVQSDGNAVIYSSGGTAIWHSGTSSSYPTTMNVFDGTLYIYEGLEVAADGDNAAAINTADPAWHESC
jgi:hypothetical protein